LVTFLVVGLALCRIGGEDIRIGAGGSIGMILRWKRVLLSHIY